MYFFSKLKYFVLLHLLGNVSLHLMALEEKDIVRKFSIIRVLIPIFLGLAMSLYLLIANVKETSFTEVAKGEGNYEWVDVNNNGIVDFTNEKEFIPSLKGNYKKQSYSDLLTNINWTVTSWFWVFVALCMLFIRDLAYIIRIRILTESQLNWRQSFNVIMLWEFASSLTPSVVGGTGIAMFIVNREGINMGRSTAIVMITAMMDNLFYLIMVPLIIFAVGTSHLFPFEDGETLILFGFRPQYLYHFLGRVFSHSLTHLDYSICHSY